MTRNARGLSPPVMDSRVRRSRERLRETLLTLLKHRGFDDLTVREITSQAGIGYTTFFRHYPSKEALLDDVAADEIRELTACSSTIYYSDNPRQASDALFQYISDHRTLWAALLTGGAAPIVKQELMAQSLETTARHSVVRLLPPDLTVIIGVTVMMELISWWLRQSDPWPVSRIAEIYHLTAIAPSHP